jgi:hypothetical protein
MRALVAYVDRATQTVVLDAGVPLPLTLDGECWVLRVSPRGSCDDSALGFADHLRWRGWRVKVIGLSGKGEPRTTRRVSLPLDITDAASRAPRMQRRRSVAPAPALQALTAAATPAPQPAVQQEPPPTSNRSQALLRQKRRCLEPGCEMVSNPATLGRHQIARGHTGVEDVEGTAL